jgi:transcriptional regulator GlxA family with amidase domain
MILAAAGRLDGLDATTKAEVIGEERPPLEVLAGTYPRIKTHRAVAVRSGGIVTSGGVSLGIDGVLYLLRQIEGEKVMAETARILEYGRALEANARALPPLGFA